MSGWIYVLELAPTGWVKVGRTNKLGARLTTHIANAGFGGASITRAFAVACAKDEAVEKEVLAALPRQPGVTLVHGKETFAGVDFPEAVRVADAIAARAVTSVEGRASIEVLPQPYAGSLDDIVAAMQGEAKVRTQVVLQRLVRESPENYLAWDCKRLSAFLRSHHVQVRKLNGGCRYVVLDDLHKSMSRQNHAAA